jgi:hypothetical protein
MTACVPADDRRVTVARDPDPNRVRHKRTGGAWLAAPNPRHRRRHQPTPSRRTQTSAGCRADPDDLHRSSPGHRAKQCAHTAGPFGRLTWSSRARHVAVLRRDRCSHQLPQRVGSGGPVPADAAIGGRRKLRGRLEPQPSSRDHRPRRQPTASDRARISDQPVEHADIGDLLRGVASPHAGVRRGAPMRH